MRALLLAVVSVGAQALAADTTPALPTPSMEAASNRTAHGGTATISGRVLKDGKPIQFYLLKLDFEFK